MACLMGASAFAAQTANVTITLKSSHNSSSVLSLTEDDANTNAYEPGSDVESMMSLANKRSVLIYGIVDGINCEEVVAANLDGLQIGFTTNQMDATQYTLSFSNFSGRELKLYDAVEDVVVTINASTPDYVFDVTAAQLNRTQVLDRFVIGEPASIPYAICHNYGKLQISGYDGAVVVKDSEDAEKINVTVNSGRKQKEVDLDGLTAGYYTVEANGQKLVIKID